MSGSAVSAVTEDPVFALHRGGKMAVHLHRRRCATRTTCPSPTRPAWPEVCTAIAEQPELVDDYTWKSQVVAVVTDGTAVLGPGRHRPGGVPAGDGGQGDPLQAVRRRRRRPDRAGLHRHRRDRRDRRPARAVLRRRQPGGHLRAALLRDRATGSRSALDIPVFHDDQHGTAVVTLAALRNAARLTGRALGELRAVISGAGAAGVAIAKILLEAGHRRRRGRRPQGHRPRGPRRTSPDQARAGVVHQQGRPDRLAGGRAARAPTSSSASPAAPCAEAAVATMADGAFIFAHGQPDPGDPPGRRRTSTPRWSPPAAATTRTRSTTCWPSPASSRGALQVRASRITEGMKLAAADALAAWSARRSSPPDCVIPSPVRRPGRPRRHRGRRRRRPRDGVARR